jgi:hypothetical protein
VNKEQGIKSKASTLIVNLTIRVLATVKGNRWLRQHSTRAFFPHLFSFFTAFCSFSPQNPYQTQENPYKFKEASYSGSEASCLKVKMALTI